jgi:hypothetical protein
MQKYLDNGTKVKVLREVDGGFLCHQVLMDPESEEEYDCQQTTFFYEKLYDTPPLSVYHEDVARLNSKIQVAKTQLREILEEKRSGKAVIQSIKESAFLQNVSNYLNGDFEYVVSLTGRSIRPKAQVYLSPYIKITNTKSNGYRLYTLKSETYDSFDDSEIQVFKTKEEAFAFLKIKVLQELVVRSDHPNAMTVTGVDHWFNVINSKSKDLSSDSDILNAYRDAREIALTRENKIKRTKLEKELKDKTELLNSLKD